MDASQKTLLSIKPILHPDKMSYYCNYNDDLGYGFYGVSGWAIFMALGAVMAMVTGTLISPSMEDTYSPGFTEICGGHFPSLRLYILITVYYVQRISSSSISVTFLSMLSQ